ncbi:hypothetical protein [Heliophilum fasciatum]|uniref:Uncharacterized protein n=1 Tax=Heliophilum fasciatum TaxID=35700 RepID=A0A4R2RS38_9FIRM|nr:hypothetical protein [Heliophilum fasciatum]MCW2278587.1 hypothetical protein [Heliophilum fasciatum]TCP62711.1 hypothetical protein EDD73_11959 [Heliophilum fasciatum]
MHRKAIAAVSVALSLVLFTACGSASQVKGVTARDGQKVYFEPGHDDYNEVIEEVFLPDVTAAQQAGYVYAADDDILDDSKKYSDTDIKVKKSKSTSKSKSTTTSTKK